mgnify:CR=1 FL=1
MSIKIGQASLGETGAHNQKAGNQNGKELNFSNWYDGRWLFVLRYKDEKKAERAAQACEAAVRNRNIGYDQDQRNTLRQQAKALNWNISAITQPCETDCSALMCVCAEAAGVNLAPQYYSGNACTTNNMGTAFQATGDFVKLLNEKYTRSDDYLLRGDVLVSSGHTVMVLEDGPKAKEEREMVEKSKMIVNGKEYSVERILKDGTNYIKIRDVAAALDLDVSNKGSIAVLTSKK